MKRWITEDKFVWAVLAVTALMMLAQIVRFLIGG